MNETIKDIKYVKGIKMISKSFTIVKFADYMNFNCKEWRRLQD